MPATVSPRNDADHANGSVRHQPDPTQQRTVSSPSSASPTPSRPPPRTTDNPPPALPWPPHASNTAPNVFATTRLFRDRDQHSWRSSSCGPAAPDHRQRRSTRAPAGPFHEPDQHPPMTDQESRHAGRRWSRRDARTSSTSDRSDATTQEFSPPPQAPARHDNADQHRYASRGSPGSARSNPNERPEPTPHARHHVSAPPSQRTKMSCQARKASDQSALW